MCMNESEESEDSAKSDTSHTTKKKFSPNKVLTFELYSDYLIKANARDKGRDKWIYDVLNGTSESDRVIFRDEKFIMFPPKRFDEDLSKFHMLSFVTDISIRSLRDLTDEHITLLQHIYSKSTEIIFKKFGIHENRLRAYIHYHPTTWVLHVHFNLISNKDVTSSVEYSYSLCDVIQNLEINGNYYRLVVMKVLTTAET